MQQQPESKPLTIKVLKGLPLAAAGEQSSLLRSLSIVFIIKALYKDRPMPDTPDARTELAELSLYSERQIRRLLTTAEQHGFITRAYLRGIDCISWDALRERFGIRHEHYYHFKTHKHVRLYDILDKKAESEKRRQCAVAVHNRVKHDSFVNEVGEEVSGGAFTAFTLAKHQLIYFLTKGSAYQFCEEAKYVLSTAYRQRHSDKEKEKILRGDLALSSRSMARLYNLKGHGSMAYKKRKWQRLGLAEVYHRVHEIASGMYTKTATRKHRLGYVQFNPATGNTELIMPDLVIDLPLSNLDHRFEGIKQAIEKAEFNKRLKAIQEQQKLAS